MQFDLINREKVVFHQDSLMKTVVYSTVGIATGYGLDDQRVGVRVPVGSRILPFSMSSSLALGFTQPHIQWVPGSVSPGVKRRGRKSDHSLPASAKVKKTWGLYIYSSIRLNGAVVI
jgi:hypothetical protein